MIKKHSINVVLMAIMSIALGIALVNVIRPVQAETSSPEDSSSNFSDDVAEHLSKVRKISIEEARERAEWQNRAGTLNDKLMETLPKSDYGGVWIDKNTDRVKIGISNDSLSSRQIINSEVDNVGLRSAVDFVPVKYSYSQLRDVKELLSSISQERAGNTDWPIQVGITPNTNQVMVHIPEDTANLTGGHQSVLAEIESKYKDMVNIQTYNEIPKEEAQCNWWFCNSPLRGAVGIKGDVGGYEDGIDCTAGFIVVGNSGTRYVVTAGHCAPAGSGWATETYNYTTKKIGPIHDSIYQQNGRDAMIIKIREDTYNWNVMGKILVRSGDSNTGMNGYDPPSYNEEYDITDSGTSGGLVGERICVSGAITGGYPDEPNGGSCGAVHEVDISWTAGGVTTVDMVRAGYCSRGGDSGMPVFRLGKALGIHRGTGQSAVCNNYKYYTGMNPIINGFNGNISIF